MRIQSTVDTELLISLLRGISTELVPKLIRLRSFNKKSSCCVHSPYDNVKI